MRGCVTGWQLINIIFLFFYENSLARFLWRKNKVYSKSPISAFLGELLSLSAAAAFFPLLQHFYNDISSTIYIRTKAFNWYLRFVHTFNSVLYVYSPRGRTRYTCSRFDFCWCFFSSSLWQNQSYFCFSPPSFCVFSTEQPHLLFITIEERKEKRLFSLFSFLSLIVLLLLLIVREQRQTPSFLFSLRIIVLSRERIRKEEIDWFVLAHPEAAGKTHNWKTTKKKTFYIYTQNIIYI